MISCVGTAPTKEVHLIDSLNQVAYSYRYKDLDSSCHAATQAYGKVNLYSQGKAEASNNLGFCAFMRMDFEKAEKFHKAKLRINPGKKNNFYTITLVLCNGKFLPLHAN